MFCIFVFNTVIQRKKNQESMCDFPCNLWLFHNVNLCSCIHLFPQDWSVHRWILLWMVQDLKPIIFIISPILCQFSHLRHFYTKVILSCLMKWDDRRSIVLSMALSLAVLSYTEFRNSLIRSNIHEPKLCCPHEIEIIQHIQPHIQ